MALVLILFIEFSERGIAFGYPTPDQQRKYRGSIWLSPTHLIRKYHGYFIYWAAVYTFWYHPFENTLGHAFGFTHIWLIMLQGEIGHYKFSRKLSPPVFFYRQHGVPDVPLEQVLASVA